MMEFAMILNHLIYAIVQMAFFVHNVCLDQVINILIQYCLSYASSYQSLIVKNN